MSAFTDHMERIHKHAPAPEDAVRPILILQKDALLLKEMSRRMEAREKVPASMWTEYVLIREDQPDLELFLADWCAMYVPPAALRKALEIVESEKEDEWLPAQHSDMEHRSGNGHTQASDVPSTDCLTPADDTDGIGGITPFTNAQSAGSTTSGDGETG